MTHLHIERLASSSATTQAKSKADCECSGWFLFWFLSESQFIICIGASLGSVDKLVLVEFISIALNWFRIDWNHSLHIQHRLHDRSEFSPIDAESCASWNTQIDSLFLLCCSVSTGLPLVWMHIKTDLFIAPQIVVQTGKSSKLFTNCKQRVVAPQCKRSDCVRDGHKNILKVTNL